MSRVNSIRAKFEAASQNGNGCEVDRPLRKSRVSVRQRTKISLKDSFDFDTTSSAFSTSSTVTETTAATSFDGSTHDSSDWMPFDNDESVFSATNEFGFEEDDWGTPTSPIKKSSSKPNTSLRALEKGSSSQRRAKDGCDHSASGGSTASGRSSSIARRSFRRTKGSTSSLPPAFQAIETLRSSRRVDRIDETQ